MPALPDSPMRLRQIAIPQAGVLLRGGPARQYRGSFAERHPSPTNWKAPRSKAVGEQDGGGSVHVRRRIASGPGMDRVEIHEPGPEQRPRHLFQSRAHPPDQLDLVFDFLQ